MSVLCCHFFFKGCTGDRGVPNLFGYRWGRGVACKVLRKVSSYLFQGVWTLERGRAKAVFWSWRMVEFFFKNGDDAVLFLRCYGEWVRHLFQHGQGAAGMTFVKKLLLKISCHFDIFFQGLCRGEGGDAGLGKLWKRFLEAKQEGDHGYC